MDSVALGVIGDARGRQRRRRLGLIAASALALAGIVDLAVGRHPGAPKAPAAQTLRVAPSVVLSKTPYMGVACQTRRCDSVGLSVWLRHPAVAVSATVAGHPLKLTVRAALPYERAPARAREMFVGYLAPLRLVTRMHLVVVPPANWAGPHDPNLLLHLRIDSGTGRILLTRLRVPVQPGWG